MFLLPTTAANSFEDFLLHEIDRQKSWKPREKELINPMGPGKVDDSVLHRMAPMEKKSQDECAGFRGISKAVISQKMKKLVWKLSRLSP